MNAIRTNPKSVTVGVHIVKMKIARDDRYKATRDDRYEVNIVYETGGYTFANDNHGLGMPLYEAEELAFTMNRICAGKFEV